jgi:hypothetical protein
VSLLCDYERVEAPKTSDDVFEAARTDCDGSCPCWIWHVRIASGEMFAVDSRQSDGPGRRDRP